MLTVLLLGLIAFLSLANIMQGWQAYHLRESIKWNDSQVIAANEMARRDRQQISRLVTEAGKRDGELFERGTMIIGLQEQIALLTGDLKEADDSSDQAYCKVAELTEQLRLARCPSGITPESHDMIGVT